MTLHKDDSRTLRKLFDRTTLNESTGCWEVLPVRRGPTGKITRPKAYYRGLNTTAARIVAAIMHGLDIWSHKQLACHTCDNEVCINPDHLYVGDALSNTLDAIKRGRLTYKRKPKVIKD